MLVFEYWNSSSGNRNKNKKRERRIEKMPRGRTPILTIILLEGAQVNRVIFLSSKKNQPQPRWPSFSILVLAYPKYCSRSGNAREMEQKEVEIFQRHKLEAYATRQPPLTLADINPERYQKKYEVATKSGKGVYKRSGALCMLYVQRKELFTRFDE